MLIKQGPNQKKAYRPIIPSPQGQPFSPIDPTDPPNQSHFPSSSRRHFASPPKFLQLARRWTGSGSSGRSRWSPSQRSRRLRGLAGMRRGISRRRPLRDSSWGPRWGAARRCTATARATTSASRTIPASPRSSPSKVPCPDSRSYWSLRLVYHW